MHTGNRFVYLVDSFARVWRRFGHVADELSMACKALACLDRPIKEAFVDIKLLPFLGGEPFSSFMTELARDAASKLEIRFSFGDKNLTILPESGPACQSSGDGHLLLTGDSMSSIEVQDLPCTGEEATMAIRYGEAEAFAPPQTEVSVRKTPKAVYIHGAVKSNSRLHVPVINIVYKNNCVQYGFCTSRCCSETSPWVSKELFQLLVAVDG